MRRPLAPVTIPGPAFYGLNKQRRSIPMVGQAVGQGINNAVYNSQTFTPSFDTSNPFGNMKIPDLNTDYSTLAWS